MAASIKELEKHGLVLEEKQKQEAQVPMVMDDAAPVMDGVPYKTQAANQLTDLTPDGSSFRARSGAMNALVWNCRGVGNSRTVRDLDALVRHHNPKLVFLSETMISESRVKNLRWRLGLKGCLAVDSRGKRGGIVFILG